MDDVQEENVAELAKNQRESEQSEAVYRKMLSGAREYEIKESTDEKPNVNELEALNEEENPPKVTSKLDFLFVRLQFCQFVLFVLFFGSFTGGRGIGCKR